MAGLWGGRQRAGRLLLDGYWPEVRLGLRHLPMDGYHLDTDVVFQFHGCMFHGKGCHGIVDTWIHTTSQDRSECM